MADTPPPGFVPLDQAPPPGFVPLKGAGAKQSLWQQLLGDAAFAEQPGGELRPGEKVVTPRPPDTEGYTGEVLPLRRDPEGGMHAAVPGMVTGLWDSLVKFGKAVEGKGPLPSLPEMTGLATTFIPGGAAARAGTVGPTRALMQDYAAAKVPFSAPLSGGRAAGVATQAAKAVPFVGSAVEHAMTPVAQRTAARGGELADRFGEVREPVEAGAAAQNRLREFAADKSEFGPDYARLDQLMHGARPLPPINTAMAINQMASKYANLPEIQALVSDPTVRRVGNLLDPMSVPPLSLSEMKDIRTKIGRLVAKPNFTPGQGIERADADRLYAALSQDLRMAAAARGPEAARAWENANRGFALHMTSVKRLEGLINAPRDEMVYARLNQAAMDKGGDSQLLRTSKRVLGAEEWGNLGASILARMGRPTPGARDALSVTPDFSPASFATNWNRLSPVAKNLLFGADEEGSKRAAVESFARIAQSQKNLGKLANVSGSGAHSNMFWMIRDALVALAGAELGHVGAIAGAAAGGYALGRVLLSQPFAKFIHSAIPPGGPGLAKVAVPKAVIGSQFLDQQPEERERTSGP